MEQNVSFFSEAEDEEGAGLVVPSVDVVSSICESMARVAHRLMCILRQIRFFVIPLVTDTD